MIPIARRLFVLLCAVCAMPLSADDLRPTVVELSQRNGVSWVMDWKLPASSEAALRRAASVEPLWPESCTPVGPAIRRSAGASVFGRIDLRCDNALAGQSFGLSALPDRTDAIARFMPDEEPSQTFRLSPSSLSARIADEPSTTNVFADYLVIGADHILFGWDHLLFVIALVLLVRRAWAVVKAATAFTVAHSLTLVATTLGYTGLPSRPVEALIALSIVFLAVEVAIVLREPERETWTRRAPWAVAFAFGLLHGFGFAGALADIGLPRGEIALALLAFNLGVEAGQLLVVAAALAVLAALARFGSIAERPVLRAATYVIGTTGSFWLIERVVAL